MNSKLIKGSLAGVAVVALAAGSTTFAAWSDFGVESSGAGAGILKLDVSQRDAGHLGIEPFNLAPGQNKYQTMFLASADAENVPDGTLTAKIQNLVDIETGPDGTSACTTNSEAIAEGSPVSGVGGNPTDLLICDDDAGELSQEATVQILASAPVPDATYCGNSTAAPGFAYGSTTPSGVGTLLGRSGVDFNLGELGPGEGICVKMEMSLPMTATNASQGDEATFEWRFDLVQVP